MGLVLNTIMRLISPIRRCRMGFTRSVGVYCLVLITTMAALNVGAQSLQRSDLFYPKLGLVIGKSPVVDPDSGLPILVVINDHGEEVEELGDQVDELADTTIWNAAGYRAEERAYRAMLDALPESVTQGHCIVSIENYGSEACGEHSVVS